VLFNDALLALAHCVTGLTHFAQDPERVGIELVKFSLGLGDDEDIGA